MSTALATLDTNLAAQYVAGEGYDYEAAIQGIKDAWAALHRNGMALGLFCLAIRQNEPSGRYLEALSTADIPRRTASRYVCRVEFILMNQGWANLAHLPGEHVDNLRKLPVPLERIMDAEDGTIAGVSVDAVARLTAHEFKRLIWRYAEDPTGTAEPAPAPKRDPLLDLAGQIKRLPPEQRSELFRKLGILKAMDDTAYRLVKRTPSDAA